jgi:hypothetical protein
MSRYSWQNDQEMQDEMRAQAVRSGIMRSAIIWTPPFLLVLFGFFFFFFDRATGGGYGGTWFLVVVLAVLSVLFGSQSIQSIMDLRGEPRRAEGTVTRRWSRSDSFVMRSHYIRLDNKQILRGDADLLHDVKAGDRVDVTYFPHSAVVAKLTKLREPEPEGAERP